MNSVRKNVRNMVQIVRLRMPALLLGLAVGGLGCSEADADPSPPGVKTPPATATESLPERAAQVWKARLDENWPIVFSFRDPRFNNDVTEEQFVTWAPENEPFVVHSYTLGDSVMDGDVGWVDVLCSTSVRRFPNVPPQETNRVEVWSRVDNAWYPVPTDHLEEYPVTPKQRDAAAEKVLAARFATMWSARVENEVKTLWSLTHPSDRPAEIPSESAEPPFKMLSHDVHWVEATDDRGRVRVTYRVKVNDPSMERLPPQDVTVIEKWSLFQGEWFFVP